MSILFIARAILKDLNKSGCFHLNWRLGMDSLDWENSQYFAISPLVSLQYKYSNFYFILMMCHYLDLGSASDWSCNKGNLLQPIRSTSQIWEVTGHGYGISVLIPQMSFYCETSGDEATCQLFFQAYIVSFAAEKW